MASAHGIIDRRAVVPSAITNDGWRHLHDAGLLVPVFHHVSRLPGMPTTPEQMIMAAVAAAGPGAMAAGRTAAWLHGARVPPTNPVHLILQGRRTVAR